MKRILFVSGAPRQGKTLLTNRLVTEHSFVSLSVDIAYIEFIKSQCPILYFEALPLYIAPHFNSLVDGCDDYSKAHFGRAFNAEWRRYLVTRIQGMASLYDRVAVEGYLLKCCDEAFGQEVATVAPVFVVSVESGRYFFQGLEMNFEAISALGT